MAYRYAKGPQRTEKTISEIANDIRDIVDGKRFMSLSRRYATSAIGRGDFWSFSPDVNDDPFNVGPTPDWQIGIGSELLTTNSMNMTLKQGYSVIFKVFDRGAFREVTVDVQGSGFKRETEKLIKYVFASIQ